MNIDTISKNIVSAVMAGHIKSNLTKAEKKWNRLRMREVELIYIVRSSSGRRLVKYAKELIELQKQIYPYLQK